MTSHPTTFLFDLGGTLLTLDGSGGILRDSRNRIIPLPGVVSRLRHHRDDGHRLFVVTNQSGISTGELTRGDVADWITQLNAVTAHAITDYACCAHPVTAGCVCRKPRPGLVNALAEQHHIDLPSAIFVGDTETDLDCAAAAGIGTFQWVHQWVFQSVR